MPPKKYAIKGEPDFHLVNDEKLKNYIGLVQQLIFSYSDLSQFADENRVLSKVWKDLSKESAERLSCKPTVDDSDEVNVSLRKTPKMRKSPVSKCRS